MHNHHILVSREIGNQVREEHITLLSIIPEIPVNICCRTQFLFYIHYHILLSIDSHLNQMFNGSVGFSRRVSLILLNVIGYQRQKW
jgi:hypothetical protein